MCVSIHLLLTTEPLKLQIEELNLDKITALSNWHILQFACG